MRCFGLNAKVEGRDLSLELTEAVCDSEAAEGMKMSSSNVILQGLGISVNSRREPRRRHNSPSSLILPQKNRPIPSTRSHQSYPTPTPSPNLPPSSSISAPSAGSSNSLCSPP